MGGGVGPEVGMPGHARDELERQLGWFFRLPVLPPERCVSAIGRRFRGGVSATLCARGCGNSGRSSSGASMQLAPPQPSWRLKSPRDKQWLCWMACQDWWSSLT
jgi:hypothetical protein